MNNTQYRLDIVDVPSTISNNLLKTTLIQKRKTAHLSYLIHKCIKMFIILYYLEKVSRPITKSGKYLTYITKNDKLGAVP